MSTKTIIIGAGITGISCAYHLKKPYIVFEKENIPGGLCRSEKAAGFTFDYSGHFFHVKNKEIYMLLQNVMKNNLVRIKRSAFVYSHNKYIPYPFQANLYNLPAKVRKDCLNSFLNKKEGTNIKPTDSFYNWALSIFGSGITRHFMKPYNEKLWTVPAKDLTAEWVAPFVPQPDIEEVKYGATHRQNKEFGYNTYFYYPKTGGCQSIIDAFLPKVKNLHTDVGIRRIDIKKKQAYTSDRRTLPYDKIISTQPLNELLEQLSGLPVKIKNMSNELKWNSVTCLNIGINKKYCNKKVISDKHWIYFPEKAFVFYRAGIYSNIVKSMAPRSCNSFYIEISHRSGTTIDREEALQRAIEGLITSGIIKTKNELEVASWQEIPYAYVIYDKNRTEAVEGIQTYLRSKGIHSIGRYGAWKYSFMEESILDARKLVETI
jgi:UDP-galactopyranose mutase